MLALTAGEVLHWLLHLNVAERENLENRRRTGSPITVTIQETIYKNRDMFLAEKWITQCYFARGLDFSQRCVHAIIQIYKVSASRVLKLLQSDEKNRKC